jgi:hypothetical protein
MGNSFLPIVCCFLAYMRIKISYIPNKEYYEKNLCGICGGQSGTGAGFL